VWESVGRWHVTRRHCIACLDPGHESFAEIYAESLQLIKVLAVEVMFGFYAELALD
jgi:hypothetical protein